MALNGGAEAELLEADAELVEAAAHAGGQHPQVGAPDREHAAVEVLALELDRRREPRQHLRFGVVDLVQADQVDREAVGLVDRARGAVDEADLALELTGQQLVGRHLVDLGEPKQPGHGDRPFAPLVGAEDRRFELEGRARFHVVKRQAFLTPNRSESLADACSRRGHWLSLLTRLMGTRLPYAAEKMIAAPVGAVRRIVPARRVKVMLHRVFNMSHMSLIWKTPVTLGTSRAPDRAITRPRQLGLFRPAKCNFPDRNAVHVPFPRALRDRVRLPVRRSQSIPNRAQNLSRPKL